MQKGPTGLKEALKAIKAKCIRINAPFPEFIVVDDAVASDKGIHEVFPLAVVVQDLKHLINRLVKELRKSSPAYGSACEMLHGALTGGQTTVLSRTGTMHKIPAELPTAEILVEQLDKCIRDISRLDPQIFTPDFEDAVRKQKNVINKVC
jgi:hypothetical protein